KPQSSVPERHARGVDGFALVDLLELKAWVVGIFTEELVRFASGFLDLRREVAIRRPEARRRARLHSLSGSRSVALHAARSARASVASLLRASCEVANWRAHSSSSSSSSSNQRAMRSCSSGGSPASFAMAASSARVIPCSIPFVAVQPNSAVHQTGARVARPRGGPRAVRALEAPGGTGDPPPCRGPCLHPGPPNV